MAKIKMQTPIVEMNGDEMTRLIWGWIKEILIEPYVDLNCEYFDLSLENREKTKDKVTKDAALAICMHGVGVKCATITPNAQRVKEYNLTNMWKSPNGTIRAILDGTVFRAPILVDGITPYIPNWEMPITIARHAYGDIYKSVESRVKKGGKVKLIVEDSDGIRQIEVADFADSDGIVMGLHNYDESIKSFARCCFNYALDTKTDIWFASKDTISKVYDHRFKDIFNDIFENEYALAFSTAGVQYFYTLIDDAVARIIRSKGGVIWACKNYDGDVMSDMVATAFGSLAMMTSVLVSPNGCYEFEAAHGTVTQHYYKYKKGEETSTNSVATIFAWTGALKKRGELDKNEELVDFANKLEKTVLKTIENGYMTKDLAQIFSKEGVDIVVLETKEFLNVVGLRFQEGQY